MGCHDGRMNELLHDPPTAAGDGGALRLTGFGLTALGGMLIGVGGLMPWIRSSLAGLPDALSPTYYGIDLLDGLVVLAACVVALGGLAVTRLTSSRRARRVATGAIIAASSVAFGVAGIAAVTAAGRFEPTVVDDVLADLDPPGNASAVQREQVEELVETRLAPGPFVSLAGGALALAGGLLVMSWATRDSEPEPPDHADDDGAGAPDGN